MNNIEIVRKGLYDNSKAAGEAWSSYMGQNKIPSSLSTTMVPPDPCRTVSFKTTVGPLLSVTWGQGCTYNDLCPDMTCNIGSCGSPHAYTGCVATATAQVTQYWQPNNAYGYGYAYMQATSGSAEVQRLMRDIGDGVSMTYGCSESGAQSNKVADFLKYSFRFASARYKNYDFQTVKSNIASHWPVLLGGCRSGNQTWVNDLLRNYGDCHEWVCDGYQESGYSNCNEGISTLYFHMNWGWHETKSNNDYNGWFLFNNWNIQMNNENRNYQYAQDMTCDIHL